MYAVVILILFVLVLATLNLCLGERKTPEQNGILLCPKCNGTLRIYDHSNFDYVIMQCTRCGEEVKMTWNGKRYKE